MTGYRNTDKAVSGRPWPSDWERSPDIDDGHAHSWELIQLTAGLWRPSEHAVRCQVCHAPRCSDATDPDPCMERKNHSGFHYTLEGRFDVG